MEAKSKLHPVVWVAAVSVTALSLAGVGAIMGVIPTVGSKSSDVPPTVAVAPAPALAPMPPPQAPIVEPAAPAPTPVHNTVKKHHSTNTAASTSMPPNLAENAPPVAVAPPAPPVCYECGVIQLVKTVEEKGEGSGLGAVGGAVVGGVLGHQVGQGRGNDVATILGAIGGSLAGNQIEKNVKKKVHYEIVVRFDDGSSKIFKQEQAPAWRNGDRVKVINGQIEALN
jgi:outer membrane lipoprotein SlyB